MRALRSMVAAAVGPGAVTAGAQTSNPPEVLPEIALLGVLAPIPRVSWPARAVVRAICDRR